MPSHRSKHLIAGFLTLGLHVLLLALWGGHMPTAIQGGAVPDTPMQLLVVQIRSSATERDRPEAQALPDRRRADTGQRIPPPPTPVAQRAPATMAAPPAPTAAEWAFAAGYKLKNSKGYRHSWGRQVRSMMGTAVEGPDQGMVRFRVEIAPDGRLSRLETLWSTSAVAERRARKAIEDMPPLPPTPTGKPLVFERTIAFTPFATDDTPIYRDDCLPDPPVFRSAFVWDGKSPQRRPEPQPIEPPDPREMEECLKQLPRDSIEAESAHDQRQLERWRSSGLAR